MTDSTIKRLLAVAILAIIADLYGCAPSEADRGAAAAAACQGTGRQDCEARDNARQVRDLDDYQHEQHEPALGYLQSPPGLLPVPLPPRNTSSN